MSNELSTVLLVEDNQDDYEATERSFRRSRLMAPIKWCRSGQEAYDYLTKSGVYEADDAVVAPDLILLDLNMPGMDGRRLLKLIKDNKETKSIPVIVLTTSSAEKDVENCYDLGASTYIQKPVSLDGLTKAIGTMKDYWFDIALLPHAKG